MKRLLASPIVARMIRAFFSMNVAVLAWGIADYR
jgi:hypothetical protein